MFCAGGGHKEAGEVVRDNGVCIPECSGRHLKGGGAKGASVKRCHLDLEAGKEWAGFLGEELRQREQARSVLTGDLPLGLGDPPGHLFGLPLTPGRRPFVTGLPGCCHLCLDEL